MINISSHPISFSHRQSVEKENQCPQNNGPKAFYNTESDLNSKVTRNSKSINGNRVFSPPIKERVQIEGPLKNYYNLVTSDEYLLQKFKEQDLGGALLRTLERDGMGANEKRIREAEELYKKVILGAEKHIEFKIMASSPIIREESSILSVYCQEILSKPIILKRFQKQDPSGALLNALKGERKGSQYMVNQALELAKEVLTFKQEIFLGGDYRGFYEQITQVPRLNEKFSKLDPSGKLLDVLKSNGEGYKKKVVDEAYTLALHVLEEG